MTDDIMQSISLNKILIAILEQHGSISVSTEKFMNAANEDKELVVDFNQESLELKFSLRNKDEQSANN